MAAKKEKAGNVVSMINETTEQPKDYIKKVDAKIGGFSKNVIFIRGDAPFQFSDLINEIGLTIGRLRTLEHLCQMDDEGEFESYAIVDILSRELEYIEGTLFNCFKVIKYSFPDDKDLNHFHYASELERDSKIEREGNSHEIQDQD
jgi:hypothetical protein